MTSQGSGLQPTGMSVFYPDPQVAAENLRTATLFTRIHICATPQVVAAALERSPQLKNTFLLGHYNDVLVFDCAQDKHKTHVRALLDMLRCEGLRADIQYSEFNKASWAEAGFYIDPMEVSGKVAFMVVLKDAIISNHSSVEAATEVDKEDEDDSTLTQHESMTRAELQYRADGTLIVPDIRSFTPPTPTTTPQQLFPLQRQPNRQYPRFTHCSDHNTLLIYIDGACLNNGQPNPAAGWGFVFREPGLGNPGLGRVSGRLEDRGPSGEPHPQTSNRAELRAVIAVLQFRAWFGEVWTRLVIATDSEYVTKGATEWVRTWGRNGWLTSSRTAVKNRDLWEELLGEFTRYRESGMEICFWKIPRAWNTEADQVARNGARGTGDVGVSAF